MTLTDQRSTIDLKGIDTPILPLTDEELVVDTDRLGRWVQDAVMTPDFPRSAQLLAARWAQDMGQTVDGVIAADPVGARYVLEATGPVTEPGGSTIDRRRRAPGPAARLVPRHRRPGDRGRVLRGGGGLHLPRGRRRAGRPAGSGHRAGPRGQRGTDPALVRAPGRAGDAGRTTIGAAFLTGDFPDAVGVFLNDGTGGQARLLPDHEGHGRGPAVQRRGPDGDRPPRPRLRPPGGPRRAARCTSRARARAAGGGPGHQRHRLRPGRVRRCRPSGWATGSSRAPPPRWPAATSRWSPRP